ncbi:3-deoxy-D-manno-octulosonatecytidylyltransferase [Capnocytophaga ochracea DSM 7271]|jgi:3-deoxy-D-manno-octulosonate cytidylyltransferase|uniref:3-deoxy-manno-octulosonate cytidylyltransferase n=1 Tax=Capnocytophaga ochracea (strain ATCC 27872 / DSM 7271 / CCUG 9716 / JCM 12966 / NCTC 12371 / SS31 / VPI 2845) TaxID=521097 RepID=C7M4G3_CAPOD|nr:3-deoxy-manno-octulosonate cytidylyltransferase [Capnocytophaga ochracea]ACU91593.1 3-deoxy-D-manno-octulosonatecytidylyltransferase [Capnocytophaga ochracea DSM 7271]UAK50373.1 3-deoxy-manno-octulosonate cytidylyltransferase [Capnocytophaga ochracea]
MKLIAMIPARYGATRFPAKLMQDLCGKPVIVHTYERVADTRLFDEVYVVTDDDRIEKVIREVGGKVIRSKKEHNSGSDRLAEASRDLDVDIIVNVQGDEPFTDKENLQKVIDIFAKDLTKSIAVASLMERIIDPDDIANPNNVKVVVNKFGEALYFSRNIIPFPRDPNTKVSYYKHIGIYAYRKEALQQFTELPPSLLEETEKLEQLRYLENGFKIRLALTDIPTIGIDTPEDLERARKRLITQK